MARIFIQVEDGEVVNVLSNDWELVGQITVFSQKFLKEVSEGERVELTEEMEDMVSVWGENAIDPCEMYRARFVERTARKRRST